MFLNAPVVAAWEEFIFSHFMGTTGLGIDRTPSFYPGLISSATNAGRLRPPAGGRRARATGRQLNQFPLPNFLGRLRPNSGTGQ
jgi:hypothetical protein